MDENGQKMVEKLTKMDKKQTKNGQNTNRKLT